ncbi:MAG: hypothetical protein IT158_02245 [Bryobacterales bacterium]|nr:hypothetical protein [Bryobacterales bacterium]
MAQLILQYAYLQVLDFLTTVAFLLAGVEEGNPLVRFSMRAAGNPLGGLLAVKCLALALGIYCCWSRRRRVLAWANGFFALLVIWNLAALVVAAAGQA